MKSAALMFLVSAIAIAAAGCNKADDSSSKPASEGGNVGIVDVNKLLELMGWNKELERNIDQTKTQVGKQLDEYLDYRKKEYETKRDEIANAVHLTTEQREKLKTGATKAELEKWELSPAQVDELLQASAALATEFERAKALGNQVIQQQQEKILRAYATAAQPSIRRVATANSRQVILMPAAALHSDSQIDLTEKVADELQRLNAGKVELPEIPKLNLTLPK